MSRIYFVAGEASGDNHGAALMRSLRERDFKIQFLGRGGPQMQQIAGGNFTNWIDQAGVVGLWEVLKHYPYFAREMGKTVAEITGAQPDAVVLIDYPGFNLRLARRLRESSLGGKIVYYISPQVWAWNRGRIPKMARWIDLMLCIFPFEADLYAQSGLRAVFVGHPMLENLAAKRIDDPRKPDLIGLFPGSRAREVDKLMPIFLEVAHLLRAKKPDLRFEVAAASPALAEMVRIHLAKYASLRDVAVNTANASDLMQRAAAGIVASGTATLEAAFFRLPFVLVYKVSGLTYLVGRLLIRVKHLGMPNVLAGREIIPEFLQNDARPAAIAAEVLHLLSDDERRRRMLSEFDEIISKLGKGGANEVAARAILETLASG